MKKSKKTKQKKHPRPLFLPPPPQKKKKKVAGPPTDFNLRFPCSRPDEKRQQHLDCVKDIVAEKTKQTNKQ